LTHRLSVNDPRTTQLRRQIILGKSFLKAIYSEWYRRIVAALSSRERFLELNSGAGFFPEFLPLVVTSEVFQVPGICLVADARALPLLDQSLDAIVMTDVFHHIPDVRRFLAEAARCIRPGGRVVMVEPWRTRWSEWVYRNLHPEPFEPHGDWAIPAAGPLSGADGASPWIVFQRDPAIVGSKVPGWRILGVEPTMPFSYLLSGRVSMRSLAPGFPYRLVRWCGKRLRQERWAMFALITLERRS
jgi:SAM-dependent methyltransferase